MDKIAIKLTIRNEDDFLDEWFQYHISLGFINYIIYDDESSDNTIQILDFYKQIVHIEINRIDTSKMQHFTHIFSYKQFDYILNIDVDEFLYVSPEIHLIKFLNENKEKGNSVIIIPRIDSGNQLNYNKNIKNLEILKYNFLKNNINISCSECKHFFDPHNSIHKDGHKSTPINNTNILYIYDNTKENKIYITEKYIDTFKLIIFHFLSRDSAHYKNCLIKYRRNDTNVDILNQYRIDNNKMLGYLTSLTYENSIHINYSKNVLFNFYKKHGFLIVRNLFDKEHIQHITNQAQNIYKTQMMKLNLISNLNINNQDFEDNIKILFTNNFDTFLNCGKQCQHIIDLWKLSLDDKIINIIKFLGIKNPNISTRPVLFSNSKYISKTDMNHTVPPHQDWASMQGSINSIVCWIPLVDINQNLGSIALVPASHKLGLLSNEKKDSFGLVDNFNDDDFKSCDVKQGDAIFFSSFLVHKSGDNITSNIRWSTHFRYNDLDETTFVENGYPHAYIYKPIDDMLVPSFDTKKAANNYFENT
jgi:ectoine hydroxylase-related dioxygenase (phytanoyl-CoA dioxygenase family)